MNERHAVLLNEIRYAERLSLRTARMYRHVATVLTGLAVFGGTGVMASISETVPDLLRLTGGVLVALSASVGIAVRPLEKAIANEAEARKYAALRTKAIGMSAQQLEVELQKARETDVPEVEMLRDVVYNDVVTEVGRPDLCCTLNWAQKVIARLA